jgi:Lar family restriction alleviation protein
MNENELLKPCPFCGGEAFIFSITQYFGDRAIFAVVCENCNASSKSKSKEEYAINAWNRRV